jgi:hypothetical protein
MISIRRIFPECNADTVLVELILQRKWAAHIQGINNVGLTINKHYNGAFIVGVVDKDKCRNKDPRIKLYTEAVDSCDGVEVMKEPGTEKHLIMVDPAFERLVWKLANDTGVVSHEGFNTIEDLKDATKTNRVDDNESLRRFLKTIIKHDPPAIQTMRKWLEKAL